MVAPLLATRSSSWDRSAEADRVIDFLLEPDRRASVLYGRRGSRRRELVREWVMPRLEGRRESYYAECGPELPHIVEGVPGQLGLEEALDRGAIVFLGRVEQCLTPTDREQQRRIARILGRLEQGEFRGSLVLLLAERNLAQMFSFQAVVPDVMANMLEISAITFDECLQRLSASSDHAALEYSPPAIELLAAEAEQTDAGDGAELARAVNGGFERFKLGSDRVVTPADCKAIGGISGALEEYRKAQMDAAAERWGSSGARAAEMILAEVTGACKSGAGPDLEDVALRLGMGTTVVSQILQWLKDDARLLRDYGKRQLEVIPAELRPVVEQRTARKQRDVMRAWGLLRDGVRSWSQLGVVLPRKRLEEISAVREWLPATDEEAAVMVRSLVCAEGAADEAAIGYWRARIRSRTGEIAVLIEALFSERPEVRVRAAELLNGFDTPEVILQLHRVATEDSHPDVRGAALTSLAGMPVGELWPVISQEARELGSPYQVNAVAALRLFPDERAAALLRELVAAGDQPPPVRAEAIRTLAALGTRESVRSLVEIGLNDTDIEDRNNAAAALELLTSRERVEETVEAIRSANIALEQTGPITAWRIGKVALQWVVSGIAGLANLFLPGVGLIALRRYRTGFLFLAITLLSLSWQMLGLWGGANMGKIIYFANYVASQLATLAVIAGRRKVELLSGVELANTRPPRWDLGTPLTIILLLLNIFPVLLVHGLAHALAGRVGYGMKLFARECFVLLWLVVSWFYLSGQFAPITVFTENLSILLLLVYLSVGMLLLIGNFLQDVVPVVLSLDLYEGRFQGWRRRIVLYKSMAGNRHAAAYLLARAAAGGRRDKEWARGVLKRTFRAIPLNLIIDSLKSHSRRPGYLIANLKRIKTREIIEALGKEWRDASPRLRRWTVDVLAGRPGEASIEQLSALRKDLDWYGRIRYTIGFWHYRLRLWPPMVILASLLMVQWAAFAVYEIHATMTNPARPVLRTVESAQLHSSMSFDHPDKVNNLDNQFTKSVLFLAETHATQSADTLLRLFGKESHDVRRKALGKSLGMAVCNLPPPEGNSALSSVDAAREKLIAALARGLNDARMEVYDGLAEIERSAVRCSISEESRKQLTAAAIDLLKRAKEPEYVRLAIAGLGATGHASAVEPLRSIVMTLKQQKTPDPGQWDDLRQNALNSLGWNRSPDAAKAIARIASSKDVDALLREKARDLAEPASEMLLEEATLHFQRGEFERAYATAVPLVEARWQNVPGLFALLGEASYRLALAGGSESGEWINRAIRHFETTKIVGPWTPERRRMLSTAYAVKAERLLATKDMTSAFVAAQRSIDEDRDLALSYCTYAWLMHKVGKYDPSLKYVFTAIEKEPEQSWSYELLQEAYLKQAEAANKAGKPQEEEKKLKLATEQFEQLIKRHPQVMWPKRRLVNIYHDHYSKFDPHAFARVHELYTEMENEFEARLAARDRLDFQANFLESRFTSGHYQKVAELGAQLDKQLAETDYELRIPVNIITYAALVLGGDARAAEARLSSLEKLVGKVPKNTQLGWSFNGTLRHIQRLPRSEMQQRLYELIEESNSLNASRRLSTEVIAANRKALELN